MEERISLYADDMLLYLGDVASSIVPVMEIIEESGVWSGLLILMALDLLPLSQLPASVPLQVVSEFIYLGIIVSSRPQDYINGNLLPTLAKLSAIVHTWCRLPLSVICRGNLFKMIVMPQRLYILHNAPIWKPAYYFHRIHHMFRERIWRKKFARIRLETLQRDKDDGHLAIPNLWLYFIVSQMQHFTGWNRREGQGTVGRLFSLVMIWKRMASRRLDADTPL